MLNVVLTYIFALLSNHFYVLQESGFFLHTEYFKEDLHISKQLFYESI